jgi:peptidoglycan hydrolase CwlO-like protein
MKRTIVAVIAAMLLASVMPAAAQETKQPSAMTQGDKDQCLLYSKNCSNQVDTLQTRIRKLNKELQKGDRVYSEDELKRLNQKLKEANDILNRLEHP